MRRPFLFNQCFFFDASIFIDILREDFSIGIQTPFDVYSCRIGRMLPRFYRVLFCRQTKRIVSHRVEDIKTLMAFVSRIDITGDIPQWVTYVQARSGWIREHIQYVILGFITAIICFKRFVVGPVLLPLLLYFSEMIFAHLLSNL